MLGGLTPYLVYMTSGYYVDDKIDGQSKWEASMSKIGKTSLKNAYERHLETEREDALFKDPLAKHLAGVSGALFSKRFSEAGKLLGYPNWPEFGITFTAVGTKMVDDWLREGCKKFGSGTKIQIVNLGSGMDTRAYRLEFLEGNFVMYEVDLPEVNAAKQKFLAPINPEPKCEIVTVDFDLLTDGFADALADTGFKSSLPTFWILEGFLTYIRPVKKQLEILTLVTQLSGAGSEICFHFKEDQQKSGKNELSPDIINSIFASWYDIEYLKFGDEQLNFGRYKPKEPNEKFSYAICRRNDPELFEDAEDYKFANPVCDCTVA